MDATGLVHEAYLRLVDTRQARLIVAVGQEVLTYAYRARTLCSEGNYDEAIGAYNEAIRLKPDDSNLYTLRAEVFLEFGRFNEALADCDRYVRLKPHDPTAAFIRVQVLLMAGRIEQYRETCKEILDRFGPSELPSACGHAVRACVLAPEAVPDRNIPVELATRAVARKPAHWSIYTLGMANFRAGQLDQAAKRFHESLAASPDWDARSLNWLGLALVHHQRGEIGEARQWLAKAVDLMEERPSIALQDRLDGQLLRREVEQLLGQSEQAKDDAESEQEPPMAKPEPEDAKAADSEPPALEATSNGKPKEKQE